MTTIAEEKYGFRILSGTSFILRRVSLFGWVGMLLTISWISLPTLQPIQIVQGLEDRPGDLSNRVRNKAGKHPTMGTKGAETANREIETAYRRTKYGWEDSSKWEYRNSSVPQQLDAVHPLIWAGVVLGVALLVLFSLSKQSEVDQWLSDLGQLFDMDRDTKKPNESH